MKRKNYILFTVILYMIADQLPSYGQDIIQPKKHRFRNAIGVSAGTLMARGYGYSTASPLKLLGAFYERQITKKIDVGINVTGWYFLQGAPRNYPGLYKIGAYGNPSIPIGTLDARYKYKMADVYALYSIVKIDKHNIKLGAGGFFGKGNNSYLIWAIINPDPPYDAQMDYNEITVNYWGIAPLIRYDFSFFKDRLVTGVHYRFRYFLTEDFTQNDINIHLCLLF